MVSTTRSRWAKSKPTGTRSGSASSRNSPMPEEEYFAGELSEKERELEENLSVEQRTHWFEAIDSLKEGVAAIDPRLTIELDDDAILNMARWPLEPIHRIPAIVVSHPEYGPVGQLSTSSKNIDVEKFREGLEKLLEQLK